ncbi:MAG TPA: phospholipase D-like domain-containing protein [Bacteroidia bacterium]|jgi:cardiolipin synthase|nr:phospholipase D-like domain-containing protein [Bacteroidia bacterium]
MAPTANTRLKINSFYVAESAQLVYSGADFFEKLITLIQSAKTIIHFQTYIYDADETGFQIANELKTAAKRGVKIYMLLDAFGSKDLPHEFVSNLKKAGIRIRFFAPFFSRNIVNLGRRLHHKIVVIDDAAALVGGINISDKYRGSANTTPWLDYAILVRGAVCEKASKICSSILNKRFIFSANFPRSILSTAETLVRFRQNDRLRGKRQISKGYLQAIKNAQESIFFVSSYFLPGRRILKALKRAANRGVKVHIILSAQSDIILYGRATCHLYASLLKQGIHIYEWEKSILHGKIAMIDQEWVTIGSFNLNYLSALSSIELNVDAIDTSLVKELDEHLQEIIRTGCRKVEYESYVIKNTWGPRFTNLVIYYLTRFVLKIMAVFPKFLRFSRED